MDSEKLGPRARDPHLAVASVSFRVPAVLSEAEGSGPASTASPQPSPDSPAPPRRLDGSAAPCASARLQVVWAPYPTAFAYQGPVLCFLPEQKVGTQKCLGKGLRWRDRSEIGVENRNGGRKSVAEDL